MQIIKENAQAEKAKTTADLARLDKEDGLERDREIKKKRDERKQNELALKRDKGLRRLSQTEKEQRLEDKDLIYSYNGDRKWTCRKLNAGLP